ncbi:unnamed protein product, partial [Callosobruchus maculatus]
CFGGVGVPCGGGIGGIIAVTVSHSEVYHIFLSITVFGRLIYVQHCDIVVVIVKSLNVVTNRSFQTFIYVLRTLLHLDRSLKIRME